MAKWWMPVAFATFVVSWLSKHFRKWHKYNGEKSTQNETRAIHTILYSVGAQQTQKKTGPKGSIIISANSDSIVDTAKWYEEVEKIAFALVVNFAKCFYYSSRNVLEEWMENVCMAYLNLQTLAHTLTPLSLSLSLFRSTREISPCLSRTHSVPNSMRKFHCSFSLFIILLGSFILLAFGWDNSCQFSLASSSFYFLCSTQFASFPSSLILSNKDHIHVFWMTLWRIFHHKCLKHWLVRRRHAFWAK